jgi:hypothetical protein
MIDVAQKRQELLRQVDALGRRGSQRCPDWQCDRPSRSDDVRDARGLV